LEGFLAFEGNFSLLKYVLYQLNKCIKTNHIRSATMKYAHIAISFLIVVLFTVACNTRETEMTASVGDTVSTKEGYPSVEDFDNLIKAFEITGASIKIGDSISQPFFSVEALMVSLDGVDIQVFEYPNDGAVEADVTAISPDGSSVGTTMPFWVASPHFFKSGRLIVLYIGSDPDILATLESILGPQIAGQ
jgi:hypothetical protein